MTQTSHEKTDVQAQLTARGTTTASEPSTSLATASLSAQTALTSSVTLLQNAAPILNLPAGENTETPVFAVADVPRTTYVSSTEVSKYLEQDRREFEKVAQRVGELCREAVTDREALQIISNRMIELYVSAGRATAKTTDNNIGMVLSKLSGAQEIDPQSWRFRVSQRLGLSSVADAEEYLTTKSEKSIPFVTHLTIGEKLFALCRGRAPTRSELTQEIKETHQKFIRFSLNPSRQTPETITEMHNDLRHIAKRLSAPEDILIPPELTFEGGRYRIGELGILATKRGGRDFVFSFKNDIGEWNDIRLNTAQLENARRGVFPKWNQEIPPSDHQHRIYPTSPLQFWNDHLECCAPRIPELLKRAREEIRA